MKDPAFLFYPNDWLGGTLGMTFEEKGAYIELLMLQFNRGHMTKRMIGQTVGQLWDKISDKFKTDADGKYYNQRLEDEQNKRKAYCLSRKNNKEGNNQHTKSHGHMSGHMTKHMENENINENIYKDIIEYLNKKADKNFKYSSKTTHEKIRARLNEKFTFDNFKTVIDKMCAKWKKDKKMNIYLRPETLFGTKFESYLNDGGEQNAGKYDNIQGVTRL